MPKKANVTSRGKDAVLHLSTLSGAPCCVWFWESHFKRDLSKLSLFQRKFARIGQGLRGMTYQGPLKDLEDV